MAVGRFFRGQVDREDGLAKTFLSNNLSLRVLGMSPGSYVWLQKPSPCRDLFILHYIILVPNKSLYLGCEQDHSILTVSWALFGTGM